TPQTSSPLADLCQRAVDQTTPAVSFETAGVANLEAPEGGTPNSSRHFDQMHHGSSYCLSRHVMFVDSREQIGLPVRRFRQQGRACFRIDRAGEQVALTVLAVQLTELGKLAEGLDPFRDYIHA